MSVTVTVVDQKGGKTGTLELPGVFDTVPHQGVMHQALIRQLANARQGSHDTKSRGEVSGGGKKPWRQKGTGRARQGSTRAPHWAGGGVALGPKPRKYDQKTPKKMIALALKSALSDRANEGKVVVIDEWSFAKPSTKAAKAALSALGLTDNVLLVLSRDDEDVYKSFRNLPEVQCMLVGELNTYDVLNNDWIVFTQATLPTADAVAPAAAAATEEIGRAHV